MGEIVPSAQRMSTTVGRSRSGLLGKLLGGAPNGESPGLRVYYASDVHGSQICWGKFLRAAPFYGADVLIMGGDLTGKAIVPIEKQPTGELSARFLGEQRHAKGDEQSDQLLHSIRFNGFYPWIATPEEIKNMEADKQSQQDLFETIMADDLREWIRAADARLEGTDTRLYVMAGNDDPWSIDGVLREGKHSTFCDNQVVRVGEHEMLSCGHANMTPWRAHRDLDDGALYEHLKELAEQLENPATAIFNIHVPPYDSGLDMAVEINPGDLTPVFRSGQPHVIPVGSRAVRQLIEEYQPLLGLHGHIHEARGEARIGRTLVLNPGSEYNTGRIHGVLVTLSSDAILGHQFVSG